MPRFTFFTQERENFLPDPHFGRTIVYDAVIGLDEGSSRILRATRLSASQRLGSLTVQLENRAATRLKAVFMALHPPSGKKNTHITSHSAFGFVLGYTEDAEAPLPALHISDAQPDHFKTGKGYGIVDKDDALQLVMLGLGGNHHLGLYVPGDELAVRTNKDMLSLFNAKRFVELGKPIA